MLLRELNLCDSEAFEVALHAWDSLSIPYELLGTTHFREYLNFLEAGKTDSDLSDGHVPTTVYYAFLDNHIIGKVHIRHSLHSFLENVDGHIGYSVHPRFQRKGYGTEMLRHALKICRDLGLERVLLICDKTNIGSIKVIKNNGGVLESVSVHQSSHKMHFWIEV